VTRWALVSILAWVGLAACDAHVPSLPPVGPADTIVALGDSLTFGTGVQENESYPAVLSTLIGRTVIREGVPGETTEQGLERLPQVLESHHPRLLLLCLGGNDMLRKVDDALIEARLRELVSRAREQGVSVMLIGVPRPALLSGTAPFYHRLAEDLGLPLEDKVLADVLHDAKLKSDAIHPNAAGYRRMAEAVAKLLHATGAL
jgi:lysophospholipase L1-like esterase